MHQIKTTLISATIAVGIAGCSSSGQKVSDEFKGATFYTMQVRAGECIFGDPVVAQEAAPLLGSIAGAILPTLVSKGVDRIGKALSAAGNSQTKVNTASANFLAKNGQLPTCIQVVRGEYFASCRAMLDGEDGQGAERCRIANPEETGTWVKGTRFAGMLGKLLDSRLYLARRPDFFFEGVLRYSRTNADPAWTVVPAYVEFNSPLASRRLRSDSGRGVTVQFGFYQGGETLPSLTSTDQQGVESASKPTDASGTSIVLGMLEPGSFLEFDAAVAATNTSTPQGGTAMSPVPRTSLEYRQHPLESPWFSIKWTTGTSGSTGTSDSKLDSEIHPAGVVVAVSETQGGNEFLQFLGDVLSDAAVTQGISDAVVTAVLPPTEEARKTEIEQEITNLTDLFTARDSANVKLQACATNGTVTAAQTARDAMLLANKQAELIKQPKPFPELLPSLLDKKEIEKACQKILGPLFVPPTPSAADLQAYDEAVKDAITALDKCIASGSSLDAIEARAKLHKVDSVADPVGKKLSVKPVSMTVTGTPDAIKASCQSFRNLPLL